MYVLLRFILHIFVTKFYKVTSNYYVLTVMCLVKCRRCSYWFIVNIF